MTRRVITAREQHEMLSPWRTASWFHPEIGIEEYPALTRKERKALYSEIKAQGGPEVLSNIYHPENWGSGDPTGEHHYIARGQDGTIHGVLAATRSYKKTEPKRPSSYSSLNVHDIYTGADAPKGTGTVLMQAAAHRAMRDGASFGVSGAVHSARPFYHNLGGTTNEINLSSGFYWEPEDRDALAMGKPNRKPVTPMPLDVWNPELKKYEKHYKMPPGADEPPEFGDIFVDNSLRQRQTTAATQYLLPGMPSRQPGTKPTPEPPDEGEWWRNSDSWPSPDSTPESDEDDGEYDEDGYDENGWTRDGWKDHEWMHVSPHKLKPGTILSPRGGPSPYNGKTLAPGHSSNVWIDFPHKMQGWTNEMKEHSPKSKFYYYDVEPAEKPEANVLGPELGWAVPSARIIQERKGFNPDYPDE